MPFNTIPSSSPIGGSIKPPVALKGVPEIPVDVSLSNVNAESVPKVFTSTNVWEVVDSSEGSGALGFCAIEQTANVGDRSIDTRLVLDGVVVWTQVAGWTVAVPGNGFAIVVIGYKDTTIDGGAAFDYVRFSSGWSLQAKATTAAGSVTMTGYIRSQEF